MIVTHFIVALANSFLTPPKRHEYEIRCDIRDPDGYIIEVGRTTNPQGDWWPADWPPIDPGGRSD